MIRITILALVAVAVLWLMSGGVSLADPGSSCNFLNSCQTTNNSAGCNWSDSGFLCDGTRTSDVGGLNNTGCPPPPGSAGIVDCSASCDANPNRAGTFTGVNVSWFDCSGVLHLAAEVECLGCNTCDIPTDFLTYPGSGCPDGYVQDGSGCCMPAPSGGGDTCPDGNPAPESRFDCTGASVYDSGCCLNGDNTPILFDIGGRGFELTSAEDGVYFDLSGHGKREKYSWTARDAENAWLVLDRNANGMIDDGTELFGNFTPQAPSSHPNGFLALAEFDKPENGGNGDGIIDSRDAVFSKLQLWQDRNHDGVSQPDELHSLEELGVRWISLEYFESRKKDRYGNRFRYKGRIADDPRFHNGRSAYDVFLLKAPDPLAQVQPFR